MPHQVYNSSNKPPPKKTTPVKVAPAPVIPKIVLPDIITPPTSTTQITPTSIIPKITLPIYSGPSGTAYTSYPTIQRTETSLTTDQIIEDNILKKYPQLLLFIPLIIIILSKK
jgi:hypothetical protein